VSTRASKKRSIKDLSNVSEQKQIKKIKFEEKEPEVEEVIQIKGIANQQGSKVKISSQTQKVLKRVLFSPSNEVSFGAEEKKPVVP